MQLKISYDDDSQSLVSRLSEVIPEKYALVQLEAYHENIFKERKKSFKLRGAYSAKHNPFAVLVGSDNNPVRAFYSESDDCTFEEIIKTLNDIYVYKRNTKEEERTS